MDAETSQKGDEPLANYYIKVEPDLRRMPWTMTALESKQRCESIISEIMRHVDNVLSVELIEEEER